jgi:hypothetical protein
LLIVGGLGVPHTFGQSAQPRATETVAPTFIPWIFDKTGIGSSIVEVKIDSEGRVTSAKCVGGSEDFPWRDHSFEHTALRWRFSSTNDAQERSARIAFVLRIMPPGTPDTELMPIYSAPNQDMRPTVFYEVRHTVFQAPVTSSPLPIDADPKRKP